jgi:hypothetical protein
MVIHREQPRKRLVEAVGNRFVEEEGLSETGAVFQSVIESEIPVRPASGDHQQRT